MTLRVKFVLFFTALVFLLIGGPMYYISSYVDSYLKRDAINNFRVVAELAESAYFTFTDLVKTRTIDWSSDGYVRLTTEKIINSRAGGNSEEYQADAKALGDYLREEKMKYDPDVIIAEVLDGNGIVIASSREERVGVDEKSEEQKFGAHRFSQAILSKQIEAFVSQVISEEDESDKPMIHVVARIFSSSKSADGSLIPLDAVLFVHFSNTDMLGEILSGRRQMAQGALSGRVLYEQYKTANIYLVNNQHLMISPARDDRSAILRQRVDSAPVHNCFNNKKEIADEYISYNGKTVIGASMCLETERLTLIAEVEEEEILKPISSVQRVFVASGIVAVLAGSLALTFGGYWFLKPLINIADAAREVTRGNLDARAPVKTKDEIGGLAKTFNQMLDGIHQSNEKLSESNQKMSESARVLHEKVAELERFKKLMVGRELKMVEMKKKIKELGGGGKNMNYK